MLLKKFLLALPWALPFGGALAMYANTTTITDGGQLTTVTVTDIYCPISTVTITSCHEQKCVPIVTVTSSFITTVYTTVCPISELPTVTNKPTPIPITVGQPGNTGQPALPIPHPTPPATPGVNGTHPTAPHGTPPSNVTFPYPPGNGGQLTTVITYIPSTTLVTFSSCHENKCSQIVTESQTSIVTTFTTTCPTSGAPTIIPIPPATTGSSHTSVTPGAPGTPATPAAPGTPATPAAPGTPATPAAPGTPATPAAPDTSGTPAAPGTPATPAAPGTSGTPDTSVPEVSVGGAMKLSAGTSLLGLALLMLL